MARSRHVRDVLAHNTARVGAAAVALWHSESIRRLLRTWYVRLLAAAALALGLATALVNLWAVRSVNVNLLPQVSAAASRALDRDVSVLLRHGRKTWVPETCPFIVSTAAQQL